MITALYRAEHEAAARKLGDAAKLEFRKHRAGPIHGRFKQWLDAQHAKQPPKSPIGAAIRYTLGQWDELGVFLDDARVPLDNNASERALRRVALVRKNHLFVGDAAAGQNLAGLYSLVATCESRGIKPFDCLADVLARVQDHPANAIDDLLPAAWAAANGTSIRARVTPVVAERLQRPRASNRKAASVGAVIHQGVVDGSRHELHAEPRNCHDDERRAATSRACPRERKQNAPPGGQGRAAST